MATKKLFDRLLLFSLFFTAYWFFGNLYEEIVMVPNHLTEPSLVLTAYHSYFVSTNPTIYFVPLTQIAIVVIFILYFLATEQREKQLLKKASIWGIGALLITALIVTQINFKLFSPDFVAYEETLFQLSVLWLVGNFLRLCLVGGTLYFIFRTYIFRQTAHALQA